MFGEDFEGQEIDVDDLVVLEKVDVPDVNLAINGSKSNSFEAEGHRCYLALVIINHSNILGQPPDEDLAVFVTREYEVLQCVIFVQAVDILLVCIEGF